MTSLPMVLLPMFPMALALLPTLMFLAGCGLLIWILLKRSSRYFGRIRRGQSPAAIERQPRPTSSWSGSQRDALARIEREQVEMQERARDLAGQLNSKIIVLEQLIATSGRQIKRLEALLAQTGPAENRASSEVSGTSPAENRAGIQELWEAQEVPLSEASDLDARTHPDRDEHGP